MKSIKIHELKRISRREILLQIKIFHLVNGTRKNSSMPFPLQKLKEGISIKIV
jgi:hypothetical protein